MWRGAAAVTMGVEGATTIAVRVGEDDHNYRQVWEEAMLRE